MEIRCPSCSTRYAIPDDKVRGRKGRFVCHKCSAKVPIDGTSLGPAVAPRAPAARAGAERPVAPEATSAQAPTPAAATKGAAAPATPATAGGAADLAGADDEDAATRFLSALPPLPRPPAAAAVAVPPPAADDSELSDAIDEDEATRMVSIIGPTSIRVPGVSTRPAAPRPPAGAKALQPAAQDQDDEATKMVTALGGLGPLSVGAGSPPSASDAAEDEATKMVTALGELGGLSAPIAPATPARAPEPEPVAPVLDIAAAVAQPSPLGDRPRELTGKTRIIRSVPPPPRETGGLLRVALLMLVAAAGGFVLSQVVNARRAQVAASAPSRSALADQAVARAAVARVAGEASQCAAPGQPTGEAAVTVRFLANGRVSEVRVGEPLAGTPTGTCVAERFQKIALPPFAGDPLALTARVHVP